MLDDVKLMFRLADSIRNEPFLISHLVRSALTSFALQTVWEGQIEHKWSDAQLVELERELAPLNFLNNYGFAMRNERAGAILEIDSMRKERDYKKFEMYFRSMRLTGDDTEPSIQYSPKISELLAFPLDSPLGLYLMPDGWYYQNELTVAESWQPYTTSNLNVFVGPSDAIAGKPLDEQLQILFKWRLFYLNRQTKDEQEEKQRLEEGIRK